MKILVVEDNTSMYENIAHTLEAENNSIVYCSSSSEVLLRFKDINPDVVVMDIRIKPLNGIKTTKMLKDIHPNAKIIMLTSHDEPEYRNAAREAGANAYVLKENLAHLKTLIEIV